MKTTAQILAVASAVTAVYAQSTPIIQSPASLVQCQPALVTFSGGTAPYYISVLPGGQASAAALEQFPAQTGNSYTWTVNIASGQDITLSIRDSTGAINYSSQVPIQASNDDSCLNGSASSAGSSSSAPASSSSSAASSSSSSSATSTSSSSSSTSAPATTGTTSGRNANANGSTSAAAPASTSPTGGAGKYLANMGAVAGVAGVVALML